MKNRYNISSKNNDFECRFVSLDRSEMNNLKGGGGGQPPIPPPPGEDFPIDITQSSQKSHLVVVTTQKVPVLVVSVI